MNETILSKDTQCEEDFSFFCCNINDYKSVGAVAFGM